MYVITINQHYRLTDRETVRHGEMTYDSNSAHARMCFTW